MNQTLSSKICYVPFFLIRSEFIKGLNPMRYVALIISFLFLLLANNLFAKAQDNFSLDLNDVSIVDALHIIANFLHENIIINQAVSGNVSLHLHKVSAEQTFN